MKLYLRKSTGEVHDGKTVLGHRCERCGGTGQFITAVVNGKPTGPGGICFRCEGKGWQSPQDEKRNEAWDSYSAARAIRGDLSTW
jgi:hypothetical protein